MNIKLLIFLLTISFSSCQKENLPPEKTIVDYQTQINHIKNFVKKKNYNQNIAFMIDYSLHSGLKRFFVVDLKSNKFINKGLVCHGNCKGENDSDYSKVFSNINNSYCTSLGMSVVGERAYSKWGKNFKYWLNGLETTNSNMKDRVVVLHAWEGVADNTIYPKSLATSFGCPTISINFLDSLDVILKKNEAILLYAFN